MYYIGIDLGGTNIKGALVSETGEIAREVSRPTRVELGAEAVCDGIAAVITELSSGVDRTSLGGVGLGCPGTVDDETGRVLYANNLGWKNFDLRAAVKSRTDFDLRIGNDANVAALAEATREDESSLLGVSTRGAIGMVRCARVWAAAQGRNFVLPDDIKALAVPVWAHRVIVDPDAAFSGATAEGIIQRALTSVPAPAVGA